MRQQSARLWVYEAASMPGALDSILPPETLLNPPRQKGLRGSGGCSNCSVRNQSFISKANSAKPFSFVSKYDSTAAAVIQGMNSGLGCFLNHLRYWTKALRSISVF